MARVTVEDCIKLITNRFELIIAASQRAREISNGVEIYVERNNDKNPVVALREIANESLTPSDLQERFIRSLQKVSINKDEDEDEDSSIENEFAAYINESALSSNEEEPDKENLSVIKNTDSIKNRDDHFEDISEDLVKNEE